MAKSMSVPCPLDEAVMAIVRMGCSCGSAQPLARLYFCRHCLEVRCTYCVSHEVDSHYCPNCLENMPSAEARLKRNRCANCFDCPSCGHTLSTRATSASTTATAAADKAGPKKVYYLSCAFCRWTSRDIGLADQPVASGGWPEVDSPHADKIAQLLEHFRALAHKEKLEKESRKYIGKRLSYMQVSERYGLSTAARKRAGLAPISSMTFSSVTSTDGESSNKTELTPDVAKSIEEVEAFPADLFDKEVDLCQVSTLQQRLMQMENQPESALDLLPKHKHLMIKRSQRCRKCEHNLSKPEYNPSSIKFKIQLAAYYHVPEVIIFRVESPIRHGAKNAIVVKIVNPSQHATTIEFLTTSELSEWEAKRKQEAEEAARSDDKKTSGLLRNPMLVRAPKHHRPLANATCLVPKGASVFIPPRDDAAEFDDVGPDLQGVVDDKSVVAWRKGNKVGVHMTLDCSGVRPGEEVTAAFALKFMYTNTISALEQKEIQKAHVALPVFLKVGRAQC